MQKSRAPCFSGQTVFFLCLLLGLQAVGRERMLRDPGTFWHIVVGDRILETGSLPHSDWMSFSQGHSPWIAQQWLGEITMAALHRIGGLDALLFAASAGLAGTYSFIGLRLRRAGIPWRWVVILVGVTIAASSYHFLARPHLFTIVAMAAMYALLCDIEAGSIAVNRLWILPGLMILWTNVHGGAIGGLATILFVLAGWIIFGNSIDLSRSRSAQTLVVGTIAGLCIVSVLANPYGAVLPATWLRLLTSPVLPQMIIEHAPPKLWSFETMMLFALAVVYLWTLRRAWGANRRVTWLAPLLWLPLAISRVRHGPLFALTATLAIAEMWPFAREMGSPKLSVGKTAARNSPLPPTAVMVVASIAIGLIIQRTGLELPLIGRKWAVISNNYWPVQTVEELRRQTRGMNHRPRVFNDLLFGGYLAFQNPDALLYIDDRCELYGDCGLLTYAHLCRDATDFDALASYDRYDFAIVHRGCLLDQHLATSPSWRALSSDPVSTLYTRKAG
jgi:hypothetical protein